MLMRVFVALSAIALSCLPTAYPSSADQMKAAF